MLIGIRILRKMRKHSEYFKTTERRSFRFQQKYNNKGKRKAA
jgi:hypothetical protein